MMTKKSYKQKEEINTRISGSTDLENDDRKKYWPLQFGPHNSVVPFCSNMTETDEDDYRIDPEYSNPTIDTLTIDSGFKVIQLQDLKTFTVTSRTTGKMVGNHSQFPRSFAEGDLPLPHTHHRHATAN